MMKLRTWLKTVVLAAFAPALPLPNGVPDAPELRHIYRLDKNGCNPTRIRMMALVAGDLFLASEPETKWTSGILRCTEAPHYREEGTFRTWSVVCESA